MKKRMVSELYIGYKRSCYVHGRTVVMITGLWKNVLMQCGFLLINTN